MTSYMERVFFIFKNPPFLSFLLSSYLLINACKFLLFSSCFMPRVKDRNPARHYVNPALLSRRRQLRLQLVHILQHLRDEMQICRMRCRELAILYNHAYLFHYNFNTVLLPPPPLIPLPTSSMEQEHSPSSPSPRPDASSSTETDLSSSEQRINVDSTTMLGIEHNPER